MPAATQTRHGWSDLPVGQAPAVLPYVRVPDQLIAAYRRMPIAIGIYIAVARCVMVAHGPIALSAADIATWTEDSDQERDRARIMRWINQLAADGWLIKMARGGATKHWLQPAWGRDQQGATRPWSWDAPNLGKPPTLRTRRVPMALLDDYIGRLSPQPGRRPATIARYFTRPLLGLADLGTYAAGLFVQIQPTARLASVGLAHRGQLLPPHDRRILLARAASGVLVIPSDDQTIVVELSTAGWQRMGYMPPDYSVTPLNTHPHASNLTLPVDDSATNTSRSASRSRPPQQPIKANVSEPTAFTALESYNTPSESDPSVAAWDDRIEDKSIKYSTSSHNLVIGGGNNTTSSIYEKDEGSVTNAALFDKLSPAIAQAHQHLNHNRLIPEGEWWELLALQHTYGEQQMLIWQSRALRVPHERQGISPGYYVACAHRTAFEHYCPPRHQPRSNLGLPDLPVPNEATLGPQERPPGYAAAPSHAQSCLAALDPDCDALLQEMGVRERERLTHVPHELIACWHTVIDHPGLAERFINPVGFAFSQLLKLMPPPSPAQLDRWARCSHSAQVCPVLSADDLAVAEEREAQIRMRATMIAPPDTSEMDMLYLMYYLEEGMSDDAALARMRERRFGEITATTTGGDIG